LCLSSASLFHWIDGIPHFLSAAAAQHLLALEAIFELVWCSGWEERADEHLPHLLGLPRGLPFLRFGLPLAATDRVDAAGDANRVGATGADDDGREAGAGTAPLGAQPTQGHWKLAAIDAYAGSRPLAWIDDCLDAACHAWAAARAAPTLLVQTAPELGLTEREVEQLQSWARTPRPAAPGWELVSKVPKPEA
jgi:hypothetical protein